MLHLFIIDKEGFMITLNKIGDYHNRQVLEIECLKADEKPIGTIDGLVITNGSKLHELDGDTYEYDEQNKTWVLQPKSSGGADGREIELQKTQTHIQWRYVGTEEWFDLVSLDEISFKHSDFTPEQLQALKGAKGDKGNPGSNGTNGKDGLSIKSTQINDSGHLILTFSDESTKDVGKVTGENGAPGKNGVSPTVEVSKSGKTTTITIKDSAGTKTAQIADGADGQSAIAPRVKVKEGDVTIQPNTLTIIENTDKGYVSTMNITLAPITNENIANEYHFFFKSSTDPSVKTTLSLPETVMSDLTSIENNNIYEVSIMENCLSYANWMVK